MNSLNFIETNVTELVTKNQYKLPIRTFTKMVNISLNQGMDIYEIRRLNAKALAASEGGMTAFGGKIGKSHSLVSRWIGKAKSQKNIGQSAAREIEAVFEKQRGWLDQKNVNIWEKYQLSYYRDEQHVPSLDDIRGLSWQSIRIARLVDRSPPEKVQAIMVLLGEQGADLEARQERNQEEKPREKKPISQASDPTQERRSYTEDRRQNVQEVDFERRSGLDRRDDRAYVFNKDGKRKRRNRGDHEDEGGDHGISS